MAGTNVTGRGSRGFDAKGDEPLAAASLLCDAAA